MGVTFISYCFLKENPKESFFYQFVRREFTVASSIRRYTLTSEVCANNFHPSNFGWSNSWTSSSILQSGSICSSKTLSRKIRRKKQRTFLLSFSYLRFLFCSHVKQYRHSLLTEEYMACFFLWKSNVTLLRFP